MLNKILIIFVIGVLVGIIITQHNQIQIMKTNLHRPFRDDIYLGIEPVKHKYFNYNKKVKRK